VTFGWPSSVLCSVTVKALGISSGFSCRADMTDKMITSCKCFVFIGVIIGSLVQRRRFITDAQMTYSACTTMQAAKRYYTALHGDVWAMSNTVRAHNLRSIHLKFVSFCFFPVKISFRSMYVCLSFPEVTMTELLHLSRNLCIYHCIHCMPLEFLNKHNTWLHVWGVFCW